MKRRFFLFVFLTVCLPLHAIHAENWSELFNGKNLNGWRVLNGTAKFAVEDGIIRGTSVLNSPNTFLVTKQEFSDFILEYDAKLDSGLNSGVQFRSKSVPEFLNGRVHGYQVDLDATPRAWSGGLYDEAGRGWLYNLECNPKAKLAYKPEAWNHFRVEAIGNHIRVWMNDVQTVDVIDDGIPSGFVALQVHNINGDTAKVGTGVQFRNIQIKTKNLEKETKPITEEIPQISYLQNELTEREKKEGWRLLWDGVSTNGWRGAKLDQFPTEGWKIENGILSVMKGTGAESEFGGDIITVNKYKNFELEADFKYTEAANSGIKYFVDPELNKGKGSAIGCEYQIVDDEKHQVASKPENVTHRLASLYDLIPADAIFYAPHESTHKRYNKDNWNRAKIIVNGDHVEHFLNGIKVVDYTRRTQMWRALVAKSKYATWLNFGEQDDGHILLQEHGDVVYYKNIKIKELPD
ncbi:DUF1080 domain-containing protein [candidate division KSB1 bacterium]|nr:DUF1080 domain-containing protein [candidate division KSB1 bacterium]